MALRAFALTIAVLLGLPSCGLFSRFTSFDPEVAASEDERLARFFEEVFLTRLDRSPELRSRLGDRSRQHEWDDRSDAFFLEGVEMFRRDLARLRDDFDVEDLGPQSRISYRLFEFELEREIAHVKWRLHDYPVNQMNGLHAAVPAFLVNVHTIDDLEDAEAYVTRLGGIAAVFDQLIDGLGRREAMGVLPPSFVFPPVIEDCWNVIRGAPFDTSVDASPLLADFEGKVQALEGLDGAKRAELIERARRALTGSVGPAYERLIAVLDAQSRVATEEAGVWKLPDGDAYYEHMLQRATTVDSTPDEIHELGVREVARIQDAMRAVLARVGFEGTLDEFNATLRSDDRFRLSNDDEGRQEYIADAGRILTTMQESLDEVFKTLPSVPLVVRAVEPFREKSAGKAFYEPGTPNGSRPGVYFVNVADMTDLPTYEMEALAYHEGLPGHHLQLSIARSLGDLPRFRRYGSYAAYTEGWGLYSERLPKEMGFYRDPYSDYGRLAMELWRACRLVVDTGIHQRRWTREQAIEYLKETTPNPDGDCVRAVERYIVMPGQATAYKVGMNRILALRNRAKRNLGSRFDLREFHEVVLGNGPVPLGILGQLVEAWTVSAR